MVCGPQRPEEQGGARGPAALAVPGRLKRADLTNVLPVIVEVVGCGAVKRQARKALQGSWGVTLGQVGAA